jgi:hypothetical protein
LTTIRLFSDIFTFPNKFEWFTLVYIINDKWKLKGFGNKISHRTRSFKFVSLCSVLARSAAKLFNVIETRYQHQNLTRIPIAIISFVQVYKIVDFSFSRNFLWPILDEILARIAFNSSSIHSSWGGSIVWRVLVLELSK